MGLQINEDGSPPDSNHIPWREMYKSAACNQASIPSCFLQTPAYRKSKSLSQVHSISLHALHQHERNGKHAPKLRIINSFKHPSSTSGQEKGPAAVSLLPNTANIKSCDADHVASAPASCKVTDLDVDDGPVSRSWTLNGRNFQLAMYVAMAHAILGALILLLYGVWMLLDDYRKPIQWAVLCSMPLREVHRAMVEFWEKPLNQGMLQTVWAIPAALFKALIGTIMDARIGLHYLQGQVVPFKTHEQQRKVGFSTLMQWLLSFALFTLGYEFLGPAPLATAAFVGMLVYAAGTSLGMMMAPLSGHIYVQTTWSILLSAKHSIKLGDGPSSLMRWLWTFRPILHFFKLANRRLTTGFLGSLHIIVAVFLISMMISGSLAGLILFSYKVGVEGKDAVVALKAHIQRSNYAERVGLKQWIEDNKVPDLIETYAGSAYGTLSDQIDIFAAQHNLTDLVKAGKRYILRVARRQQEYHDAGENISSQVVGPQLFLERLQNVGCKISEYDLKGVYSELEQAVLVLLEHFHMSKEDLVDKTKQLGKRWVDIGKRVVGSSSTLLAGSTYLLASISYSIVSGAAGVVHFLTQMVVFFSVLYYLILSETGGVMKQVLSMVPLSESTRSRCATVLEDTISSVLLSTAKAAFFQATFTWLLFRFFDIHFLYMSTLLALFSALLSLPCWLQVSSLVAGAQLAVAGRYVHALLLMLLHSGLLQSGVSTILHDHQGSPAPARRHFTGLSLAVGLLLFWPSPERAIMGPLFITLLIALKNLYLEFVLDSEKEDLPSETGGQPADHISPSPTIVC